MDSQRQEPQCAFVWFILLEIDSYQHKQMLSPVSQVEEKYYRFHIVFPPPSLGSLIR